MSTRKTVRVVSRAPKLPPAANDLEVTGAAPNMKLCQLRSAPTEAEGDAHLTASQLPLSPQAVLATLGSVRESIAQSRIAVSVLLSYQSFRLSNDVVQAEHVRPFVAAIAKLDAALGEYRNALKFELRAHKKFIND